MSFNAVAEGDLRWFAIGNGSKETIETTQMFLD